RGMGKKMGAMIQADLARLGVKVNLATLESRALLSVINDSLNYEACLLAIVSGDADPTSHINILSSDGLTHWWSPRQTEPATGWEARIDDLMKRQMRALDQAERKKLFDEVQAIMAEDHPSFLLASPMLTAPPKTNTVNLKPALRADLFL